MRTSIGVRIASPSVLNDRTKIHRIGKKIRSPTVQATAVLRSFWRGDVARAILSLLRVQVLADGAHQEDRHDVRQDDRVDSAGGAKPNVLTLQHALKN